MTACYCICIESVVLLMVNTYKFEGLVHLVDFSTGQAEQIGNNFQYVTVAIRYI